MGYLRAALVARGTAARFGRTGIAFLSAGVALLTAVVQPDRLCAVELVNGAQPAAIDQPQINVIMRNQVSGAPGVPLVGQTIDPNTFENVPTLTLQAYLDTGASGTLISVPSAQTWGVPTATFNGQPVTYNDVGVVGTAQFNVSQPIYTQLAPYNPTVNALVEVNTDYSQIAPKYSAVSGPITIQVGPSNLGGSATDDLLFDDLNVVGMPNLVGKTMVIDPRSSNVVMHTLATSPDDPLTALVNVFLDQQQLDNVLLKTYVYNPGTPFNPSPQTIDSDPGIPGTNLHVKLSKVDFSRFTTTMPTGAPGPTLTTNPFIGPDPRRNMPGNPFGLPPDSTPAVTVGFGGLTTQGSFLLDTGAGASFLSSNIAAQLHVRYVSGTFGPGLDNPQLEMFLPTADPTDDPRNGTPLGLVPNQFKLTVGGIGGSSLTTAGFYLDSMLVPTMEGSAANNKDPSHLHYLGAPVLVTDISVEDSVTHQTLTLDGDFGMNFLVGSLFLDVSDLSNIAIGGFTPGAFDWVTFDETSGVLGLKLNSAFHIAGDFDLDGKLTAADIAAMMNALADTKKFGADHGLTEEQLTALGDIEQSGTFTNADLQLLITTLANSGGAGSLAAVPEPAGVVLAVLGAAAMLIVVRRGRA
jgi:hypothetical protein